jgi:hypothetical protein
MFKINFKNVSRNVFNPNLKDLVFSDAMSLVHLELMGQNVNLLVNVKTEDLVILLLENVIAQKDGL